MTLVRSKKILQTLFILHCVKIIGRVKSQTVTRGDFHHLYEGVCYLKYSKGVSFQSMILHLQIIEVVIFQLMLSSNVFDILILR